MKKIRTSDEIQSEINRLEWELKELREELYASNAINNPSYDEYKNKWVFYAEDEFLEVFFNIVRYSLPYFQWTTRDLEEDTLYLLEGAAYGFAYHGE